MRFIAPLALLLTFSIAPVWSVDYTWVGGGGTDWSTGSNWSPTGPPSLGDLAIIPAGPSNMPTLTANITFSTLTINSGATLTLAGFSMTLSSFTNAGQLTFNGTEFVSTAPFNLAGSTVAYAGSGTSIVLSTWTYRNLSITGSATFSLTGTPLTVNENILLAAGTLNTTTNDYAISVSSRWINTGGNFISNASTVTFNGTTPGLTIRSNGSNFTNVHFNGVSGYWTLQDSMTFSSMTLTAGTFDSGGQPILSSGGWFNGAGTYIANGSTLTLNGPTMQRIDQGGEAFGVLIDSNTSASGVVFLSSFSASRLYINPAGLASATTVYFNGGSTFTITSLSLTGASGSQRAILRSLSTGATWFLNNTGTNNVTWVDVRDSDARPGRIVTATNALDSGNNRNWDFGAAGTLRTWWGTSDRVWSNGLNWSTGQPISSKDSALIVSTATFMPTLTANVTISSLTINAGSSVTLAGFNLTLSSFTNSGTLVLRGNENIPTVPNNLAGSTITYNTPSGTNLLLSTWTYRNLVVAGGGTFNLAGTPLTVNESLTLSSGTLNTTASNFAITVSSNWLNTGGAFIANASTVTFNGTTPGCRIQSNSQNFAFVQINGAGGYWTLTDSMTVTSTMTITAGTLDASASNCSAASCDLVVGGSWFNTGGTFRSRTGHVVMSATTPGQRIRSRGFPFNRVTTGVVAAGGYYVLIDSLTVSTMTVNAGSSFELTGFGMLTSSLTVGGNFVFRGSEPVTAVPTMLTGSTVTYNATAATSIVLSTWTYRNLAITGAGTFNLAGSTVTVSENITLAAGTLNTTASNFAISVSSNWINTGGNFTWNASTVTFAGTSPGLTIRSNGRNFSNVQFNGVGGYWVLQDSMTVSSMTLTAGTFDSGGQPILSSGGWFNGAGTYVANGSTLTLNGPTAQRIDQGGEAFGVLIDSNTSGGGVVFASSFSASRLYVNSTGLASATTIYFNGGSTFTVTTLNLRGGSGSLRVNLRPLSAGATWYLNNVGTSSATWVNVRDSDARSGQTITATNSLDSGNNKNWDFGNAGTLRTWWGTTDTVWSNGLNWDTGQPISTKDSALIVSTATFMPTLTSAVSISTLTINAGSSVTLAGFGLTLSSFTNSGALVLNGTEPVLPAPNLLSGSTVTYSAPSGTSLILSTWTYRNLVILGSATFNVSGAAGLSVREGFTVTAGTVTTTGSNFPIDVTGPIAFTGGTFTLNASSITARGNWTAAQGASFNAGTSTVAFFNSGTAQIVSHQGKAFHVLIDSNTSAGGITFSSSFTCSQFVMTGAGLSSAATAYFNAGSTFTVTTLTLRGSSGKPMTLRSSQSGTFWSLNNLSTHTVTFVDVKDSDARSGLVINAYDGTSINSGNNLFWGFTAPGTSTTTSAISGNWYAPGTWTGGIVPTAGSTVTINASHVITSTGPFTVSSMTVVGQLNLDGSATAVTLTIKNGGTLTNNGVVQITNDANAVTIQGEPGGSMQYLGADIDHNINKVFLARVAYRPATTIASGEAVELSGSTTFYAAVTTNSGGSLIHGANHDLIFVSNTTLAAGTFTKSTGIGRAMFLGDLTLTSNSQDLGNVIIGASPDTTTLGSDFSATSLTINPGDIFNTKGYEVSLSTYLVIIGSGTLDATDTGGGNEGDGTKFWVGGNWTMAPTSIFTAATSSVTFNGTAPQVVDHKGKNFNALLSTNTAAGGVTFSSSWSATNFTMQSLGASATVYFRAGSTFTINGLITLGGASGQAIVLRSTSTGSQWMLNVPVTSTAALSFLNVQDSNAGAGQTLNATNGVNFNAGNNVNWNFGGWQTAWNSSETESTFAIAWGDFDGDGDLDFLSANYFQTSRVYRNNGNGTFGSVWNTAETNFVYAGAWGDYDEDGDVDFVVVNDGSSNRVYRNNGNGTFGSAWNTAEVFSYARAVSWGDYDSDGDLDLAIGNVLDPNYVYRNNGNGTLVSAWNTAESEDTRSLSWGDSDNDGDMDLLVANSGQTNRVYRNNGNGTFTSSWNSASENTYSIQWADFDSDGDLDFGAGNASATSRVYRNNGNGTFASAWNTSLTEDTRSVGWGDYDSDGDLDLLLGNSEQTNRVYRNDGSANFISAWNSLETEALRSIAWGDFDGDGRLDMLAGNIAETNRIYQASGFVANSTPTAPTSGFSSAVTGSTITFRWGNGSDTETTDPDVLMYTIRVATQPWATATGTQVIVSSASYATPFQGNYYTARDTTTLDQRVTLGNLPAGATFYWSVRTIDTGLKPSGWSAEQSTDLTPPAAVADFAVVATTNTSQANATWTSPGDNGSSGNLTGNFRIQYATSTVSWSTSSTPSGAYTITIATTNVTPGQSQVSLLSSLSLAGSVYFRLWSQDAVGNWSNISNGSTTTIRGWMSVWNTSETESTYSIAWGDYDGDGDLDFAAGNYNQTNRVYRNNGNGTFVSVWNTSETESTNSVAWGDYDGDGDLDLAAGNYSGINRVYRNNGNATFVSVWNTSGTEPTLSIAWGDYDGDGDLDFAAGNDGQTNRVYRNNGNATFVSVWNTSETESTNSVAWGDYDGDGDLDLATGNFSETNRVYRNNGNATFVSVWNTSETEDTYSIAWGDYDADGDLDFTSGNELQTNRVYRNNGNATFVSVWNTTETERTFSIAWGDYDSDGDLDLAAGNDSGQSNRVYRNNGDATFVSVWNSSETESTDSIAWGDYDGDGRLDLVVGNYNQTNRLYQAGGFVANSTPTAPTSGFSSAVTGSTITFRWGNGSDTETTDPDVLMYTLRVATQPWATATRTQVIVSSASYATPFQGNYYTARDTTTLNQRVTLYGLSAATTYYWSVRTIDSGLKPSGWSAEQVSASFWQNGWNTSETEDTYSVAWGDYDRDGDLDFAAGNSGQTNRVYRNNGNGTFVSVWNTSETENTRSVAWGDYDGDGDLDFAAGNVGQTNRVYRNNGDATFASAWNSSETEQTYSIGWGDYDGDGDLDLAAGNYTETNRVYRNNGNGTFVSAWNTIETESTLSTAWGDHDGDGDLDLAAGNASQTSRVYRNNGNGTFVSVWNTSETEGTYSITWTDYDGDGDLDFALGNQGGTNRVYRNNGNATFTSVWNTSETENTLTIAWGDYDGDGDLDFAAGNSNQTNRVYRNNGDSTFTSVWNTSETEQTRSMAWGDYDGDGRLDLAAGNSGQTTRLYQAVGFPINTAPATPGTGFSSSTANGVITLRWGNGSDTQTTDADVLTYTLRFSTGTAGSHVRPPYIVPDELVGSPLMGNYLSYRSSTTNDQRAILKQFTQLQANNTYYWQVRTIDTGLMTSTWTAVQQFYVAGDITPPNAVADFVIVGTTNPSQALATWTAPGDDGGAGTFSGLFRIQYATTTVSWSTTTTPSSAFTLDIATNNVTPGESQLTLLTSLSLSGTVYFRLWSQDETGIWSNISNGSTTTVRGWTSVWNTSETEQTRSIAWADFDQDGDLDFLAGNYAQTNRVYRNNGNGTFVSAWNTSETQNTVSVAWGDYDGDGDFDFAAGNYFQTHRVYRNNGNATFVSVWNTTETGGLISLAWGDQDGDGDLDFASGNYAETNRVYRNNGNGTFVSAWNTIETENTNSIAWGDHDGDGDLDLAAGNASQTSRVYRNNGNGTFVSVWNTSETDWTTTVAWGDYDGDGDLDFAASNEAQTNRVYRNNGNATFVSEWNTSETENTYSVAWGDYDGDGDLDLAAGNNNQTNRVYRNNGVATFVSVWNTSEMEQTRSIAWGDYDGDGRLDMAAVNNAQTTRLYQASGFVANSTPTAPTSGFSSAVTGSTITFRWGNGSDTETTDPDVLMYTLRVATQPWATATGTQVIVSSASYATPFQGNYYTARDTTTLDQRVTLGNLPAGATFYWSVRTIDTGLKPSGWSAEQQAPVATGGGITSAATGNWHNPATWTGGVVPVATDTVTINSSHIVTSTASFTVSSMTVVGQLSLDGSALAVTVTIKNGGTLTNNGVIQVASSANSVTVQGESGGSIQYLGTDIDYNTKKIYLARVAYVPAVIVASGETIELSGSTTFYATLTTNSGGALIHGANHDLIFRGNTTLATGTFTKSTGTGRVLIGGNVTLNSNAQDLGDIRIGVR